MNKTRTPVFYVILQPHGRATAIPGTSHTDAKGCFVRYLTLRATDQKSRFDELEVRTSYIVIIQKVLYLGLYQSGKVIILIE